MLPSWIAEPAPPRPPARSRPGRFLARTLQDSARFVEQAVFAESVARRRGYLQRLDARAKLLSILALLVAAAFLHHLLSLLLIAAFAMIAAACSQLRPGELANRVWWFAPAGFVLVALPAALNVITPGEPLLTILRFDGASRLGPLRLPAELAITRQGLASAALVVTRVFVGVALAVTLTLTTRWQELLRAASTSVTAPFVLVLAMTYRYLFVLLRVVEDMHLAKRARTIDAAGGAEERRWVGGRIGFLYLRSRRLSEQVHAAMVARGYDGNPRSLAPSGSTAADGGWVLACLLVGAAALIADRTVLAGLPW